MEDKKTIFDYLGQLFATYGITVAIFIVFGMVVGEGAREFSTLFALGNQGISFQTLAQLFLLALIITVVQILFLTDRWVKNMQMLFRNVCFFGCICVAMVVFAVLFAWFPIGDVKAWIGFTVSFAVCTVISVVIGRAEEKAENRKMEQALKKFRE